MARRAALTNEKIRLAEEALKAEKFEARREELAQAALETLGALGYARASLREIAQNTPYSHGLFHYYFRDKHELIGHCVRSYKQSCVRRYDAAVEQAGDAAQLLDRFLDALEATLREDCDMHRLWYDLRAQSLFDATFQADVLEIDAMLELMVWRIGERHAGLLGRRPALPAPSLYALMDGLFQRALLEQSRGQPQASERLLAHARDIFERFC